jgi:hypothetical protein
MKIKNAMCAVAALGVVALCGQAQAGSGLCKLTGGYTDDYGSVTSIKGKAGSILNTSICATAYTFKITDETKTGFTATGKNSNKSCGTFSVMPTFMGSCSVFGGTVTIHGIQLSDTFTKKAAASVARAAPASGLTKGMY